MSHMLVYFSNGCNSHSKTDLKAGTSRFFQVPYLSAGSQRLESCSIAFPGHNEETGRGDEHLGTNRHRYGISALNEEGLAN